MGMPCSILSCILGSRAQVGKLLSNYQDALKLSRLVALIVCNAKPLCRQ